MQTIKFTKDKRHWFGGLFCLDSTRGITTISLTATFLKLKLLWRIVLPWDGFKQLTYFDVRSYLLSNHFRFAVNKFFMDYDSEARKKFVVYPEIWLRR